MYQNTLISSREGINQEPEKLQQMDRLVSPLIKKGNQYPIFTTAIQRSLAAHALPSTTILMHVFFPQGISISQEK